MNQSFFTDYFAPPVFVESYRIVLQEEGGRVASQRVNTSVEPASQKSRWLGAYESVYFAMSVKSRQNSVN